jgi:nucleoside triphosphate pyrophosphatase
VTTPRRLVLASQSPARLQLMRQAGLNPEVVVSGVDESTVTSPRVAELVALLASAKAAAVAKNEDDALVVAADSLLEFRGQALGKPADAADARLRWQRMSGRSGTLHTGQAVFDVRDGAVTQRHVGVSSTVVHFATPSAAELDAYLATGEPLGVAGAFTLDGLGAPFVRRIEGDPSAVIGLSLALLRSQLAELGSSLTSLWHR